MVHSSPTINLDVNGATRVAMVAARDIATVFVNPSNETVKIPATPVANRRWLLICYASDTMMIGSKSVTVSNGYASYGSGRGAFLNGQSKRSQYSNRRQFLRSQYQWLAMPGEIDVWIVEGTAAEWAGALELS